MHEYSIVQALVGRVQAEVEAHAATRVHRIWVRIGEVSGVEVDLLRQAYELFREHSVCAGAELEIEPVAARWSCSACQRTLEPGQILRCPECAQPARLEQGDEIVLQRVEMEVA